MRLIAEYQVGPYPVEVYEQDEPLDKDDPDGDFDGTFHPYRIRVNARVQGTRRWAVILHELVHLALSIMNLEVDQLEEPVCDAVALVMTQCLADKLGHPPTFAKPTVRQFEEMSMCGCPASFVFHDLRTSQFRCSRCMKVLSSVQEVRLHEG